MKASELEYCPECSEYIAGIGGEHCPACGADFALMDEVDDEEREIGDDEEELVIEDDD